MVWLCYTRELSGTSLYPGLSTAFWPCLCAMPFEKDPPLRRSGMSTSRTGQGTTTIHYELAGFGQAVTTTENRAESGSRHCVDVYTL